MNKRTPEHDMSFRALENNRANAGYILGNLEAWLTEYPHQKNDVTLVLTLKPGFDAPKDFHRAGFILDDKESLQVFYVAGWNTPDHLPHKEWRIYLKAITPGTTRWNGPRKHYFLETKKKESN